VAPWVGKLALEISEEALALPSAVYSGTREKNLSIWIIGRPDADALPCFMVRNLFGAQFAAVVVDAATSLGPVRGTICGARR